MVVDTVEDGELWRAVLIYASLVGLCPDPS